MRFASIIFLTLSILGCSPNSTQRSPTAPTPPVATSPPVATPTPAAPPRQSSNLLHLWGCVVDPSGVSIEGATVEVVRGPVLLGEKATQTTACDLTRFSGGFHFDEAVHVNDWDQMTLRASAPGHIPQEQNLSQWGWSRVPTFTLVPVALDD
jgi:hypothetical protein